MTGPPSADPATATSDVFYALQSPGARSRPGERVSVQLPLTGAEQALVVPTAAVVYDMNGGAWVYEATGATTFVRRRIEIRSQVGAQDPRHARHRRREEGRHRRRRRVVRHRVRGGQVACAGSSRSRSATRSSSWRSPAIGALAAARSARNIPLDVFPEFAPPLVEIQTEAPGPVDAGSRIAGQRADRERARRRAGREDDPLEVGARPVVGGPDPRRRRGSHGGAAARAGAARHDCRAVAGQRASAGDAGAAVVAQPPDEDRHHVADAVADRDDDDRPMDGAAAIDGRAGRRQRRDLGPARQATAGARRSGSPRMPITCRSTKCVSSVRDGVSVETGGFVDTPNQRLAVAHAPVVTSAADLAGLVVTRRVGAPLRVGDVATVVQGHQAPIGDAIINDVPGPAADRREAARRQHAAGHARRRAGARDAEAGARRPAGRSRRSSGPRRSSRCRSSNLNRALLIGCVLVVLVLMFFLADWRTALISSVAIPLSLLAAAMMLRYRGGTIDTMVLAGLVIALGEVVDDAIIDVENIVRRLRLNRAGRSSRGRAIAVVFDASLEVRSAVVFGSLIVMLVFLPVFMLEGLSGAFFRPLATAYVLAILASLFVALTITPALSLLLLPKHLDAKESRAGDAAEGLVPRARCRGSSIGRCWPAALLVGLMVATLASVPLLGEEFLPNFREYDFLMHWVEKPGHLDRGDAPHHRARQQGAARHSRACATSARTSAAPRSPTKSSGRTSPSCGSASIPSVDYDATVAKIQDVVDGYPGLYRDLLTYLRERIKEVLTGASATIVVRIEGPDLDRLQAHAGSRSRRAGADRRRRRSQGAAAGAGAADRSEVPARARRAARAHRRRRAPRRHDGRARRRRSASSSRISASSTSWCGARPRRAAASTRCARFGCRCPAAAPCR